MANSAKRLLSTLHRLSPSPTPRPLPSLFPRQPTAGLHTPSSFLSNPSSPSALLSRLLSQRPKPLSSMLPSRGLCAERSLLRGIGRTVVEKPMSTVRSSVARYRKAVGLHTEAFWKRNYLILVGAGAVVVCVMLWRIMFGIANTFVGLSEGMAKYGFLALAAAMVSFSGMYMRSRYTIKPDKIYRIAMRKLNTSAGILEVMGAPLTGSDARAYVMSGGGYKLKNFKFRSGGKRCFLIFPVRGSERRGLVSVEAKKKKGQYDVRLLAVDIPMASGPDQRIFLIGDEEEYKVGGGLISELRDPIIKAMAAEEEFEDLDEKEEEDEAREREEAEQKQREEEERALEEAESKRRAHENLAKASS